MSRLPVVAGSESGRCCTVGNRRTSENLLQETAEALRCGRKAASSIEVVAVEGHGLAAWHISSRLAWGNIPADASKVLITPVRPSSSGWIGGILDSLGKELGKTRKLHPRPFRWESSEEEQYQAAVAVVKDRIGEDQDLARATVHDFEHSTHPIVCDAASQGRRLFSLRGGDTWRHLSFLRFSKGRRILPPLFEGSDTMLE